MGIASIAAGILLARIDERAGLGLEREREERRGLWPAEAADGAERT